jgi:hypothetical protein
MWTPFYSQAACSVLKTDLSFPETANKPRNTLSRSVLRVMFLVVDMAAGSILLPFRTPRRSPSPFARQSEPHYARAMAADDLRNCIFPNQPRDQSISTQRLRIAREFVCKGSY